MVLPQEQMWPEIQQRFLASAQPSQLSPKQPSPHSQLHESGSESS